MYRSYFSRFLNERKRKLKAAYIVKVITSVAVALAISSSFAVMARETDPLFETLVIDITLEDDQGMLESLDDNPDFDIKVQTNNLNMNVNENAVAEDENDNGALAAYELATAEYAEAEAVYTAALENYWLMKAACLDGMTEYAGVKAVYEELADLYQDFVEAYVSVQLARGNADPEFKLEMEEYRVEKAAYSAAMKVYRENQSEYVEKIEEYNAAMNRYKHELSSYAKELSSYAKKLADYRMAQAAYEAEQLNADMTELSEEMNAPVAPTAPIAPNLVKPAAPQALELARPEIPATILIAFAVELEDFFVLSE